MELSVVVDQIANWIQNHQTTVWWLGGVSVLTFVGTLVAIPILVVRIPDDYFLHPQRETTLLSNRRPVTRILLLIAKNMMGGVFVIAGIAMLILPGQGLLTILIGLILIDFPGKYQIEKWLVTRAPVLRAINWLRRRSGRPPIRLPE